jgi:hypothetical protein
MHRFLVSTFRRLMNITLDPQGDLHDISVVSDTHGVYFGITRRGPFVFVAERNLDIHKEPITLGDPQDVIRLYLGLPSGRIIRTPISYASKAFDDLHQIAYDRGALFVTSAKFPFVFRKGLFGGRRGIDITDAVPAPYVRQDDRNHDAYHINSVSVDGDHLMVLAHNWDQPSFAIRMSLRDARRGRMTGAKVYEDLGFCCHDIIPDGDVFWTLDSGGSALVRVNIADGTKDRFLLTGAGQDPDAIPFPRGVDILDGMLAVTYGFNEDRADRMDSNAMIALFDLREEAFVKHLSLGAHGNTCAVLAL